MTTASQPSKDGEHRNWLMARIHKNPRQAALIGFVLALLIFALIRGFISDDANRTRLTETAKERWALIQTGQESFYDQNDRYAGTLDALEGVDDVLTTPDGNLLFEIDANDTGARVEMTLSGATIRLSRTLEGGEELSQSCQILASRAGSC